MYSPAGACQPGAAIASLSLHANLNIASCGSSAVGASHPAALHSCAWRSLSACQTNGRCQPLISHSSWLHAHMEAPKSVVLHCRSGSARSSPAPQQRSWGSLPRLSQEEALMPTPCFVDPQTHMVRCRSGCAPSSPASQQRSWGSSQRQLVCERARPAAWSARARPTGRPCTLLGSMAPTPTGRGAPLCSGGSAW